MQHKLTHEQTRALIARSQAGDRDATEELLADNAGMINRAAQAFRYRFQSWEFEDLQQEARLGMLDAIERFNLEMGTRFSTYADWCMRGRLTRAMREDPMIRLPYWWTQTDRGREKLEGCPRVVASLDQPIGGEETSALGDLLTTNDTTEGTVFGAFSAAEITAELEPLLDLLKPLDREALLLYFGTDCGAQRTLSEVGAIQGVTRECVRQRILRAIFVIRKHARRQGKDCPPPCAKVKLTAVLSEKAIWALYEQGVPTNHIAARFDCSTDVVRDYICRHRARLKAKKKKDA